MEGCDEQYKDVVDAFSALEACVGEHCEEICDTDQAE